MFTFSLLLFKSHPIYFISLFRKQLFERESQSWVINETVILRRLSKLFTVTQSNKDTKLQSLRKAFFHFENWLLSWFTLHDHLNPEFTKFEQPNLPVCFNTTTMLLQKSWMYVIDGSLILLCSNGSPSGADRTPFDEEEWDDGHIDPLVDNGEPGIKVRALYDYEAAEEDELDFKAGTKLK